MTSDFVTARLSNLNELLIQEFPELQDAYQDELNYWDDVKPGAHVIYGDIFAPYLENLIVNSEFDAAKKAFDFLEKLLESADVEVQEVAALSVLEYLHDRPLVLDRGRPFFGPKAKQTLVELEEFWGSPRT